MPSCPATDATNMASKYSITGAKVRIIFDITKFFWKNLTYGHKKSRGKVAVRLFLDAGMT